MKTMHGLMQIMCCHLADTLAGMESRVGRFAWRF